MEEVDGFDGGGTLLLVAEDEIDPFVEMLRDVVALQGRAVDADEFARIVLGPGRQDDVVEGDAALLGAQVEAVAVDQHVRQVEEFRNELFDVGHVQFGRRRPRLAHRMEQSIGQIEMTT